MTTSRAIGTFFLFQHSLFIIHRFVISLEHRFVKLDKFVKSFGRAPRVVLSPLAFLFHPAGLPQKELKQWLNHSRSLCFDIKFC